MKIDKYFNKYVLSCLKEDKFDNLNNLSIWKVLRKNSSNEIYVNLLLFLNLIIKKNTEK